MNSRHSFSHHIGHACKCDRIEVICTVVELYDKLCVALLTTTDYVDTKMSLVELYTAVNNYLIAGHFNLKVVVNCNKDLLVKTSCYYFKHLLTFVYCSTSEVYGISIDVL